MYNASITTFLKVTALFKRAEANFEPQRLAQKLCCSGKVWSSQLFVNHASKRLLMKSSFCCITKNVAATNFKPHKDHSFIHASSLCGVPKNWFFVLGWECGIVSIYLKVNLEIVVIHFMVLVALQTNTNYRVK